MKKRNYNIVAIIGSLRFKATHDEIVKQLFLNGDVPIPLIQIKGESDSKKVKRIADEHIRKVIDIADYVYVINENGYIGSSVLSEIEYAVNEGKLIICKEAPLTEQSCEIISCQYDGSIDKTLAIVSAEINHDDVIKYNMIIHGEENIGKILSCRAPSPALVDMLSYLKHPGDPLSLHNTYDEVQYENTTEKSVDEKQYQGFPEITLSNIPFSGTIQLNKQQSEEMINNVIQQVRAQELKGKYSSMGATIDHLKNLSQEDYLKIIKESLPYIVLRSSPVQSDIFNKLSAIQNIISI